MEKLLLLIRKELLLEWRGFEFLTVLFSLQVMLAALVSSGVSAAFLEARVVTRIFPTLLWIICIVSSVIAASRSHEAELEHGAYEGVILSGVSPSLVYIAKTTSVFLFLFSGYLLSLGLLSVLLDVSISSSFFTLLAVGGLGILGISALLVLASAVAATSRLKGILLPLIVLPLTLPIFWGVCELSQSLGVSRVEESWWSVLFVSDVVYLLAGINLYAFVITD